MNQILSIKKKIFSKNKDKDISIKLNFVETLLNLVTVVMDLWLVQLIIINLISAILLMEDEN